MAAMESIDQARDALDDSVSELVLLLKAFREFGDEVGGPCSSASWPSWLFVMEARVDVLERHAQAYMMAVHQHARPVLQAMEHAIVPFPTA